MKKTILLSIILTVTSFTVFSQPKHESIRELFRLMKAESMFDNIAASFQGLDMDSTSKGFNSSFLNAAKPLLKKIMDEDMVALYDKYYSQKEINDFIRFYKSKTGQKMINTGPELQKEIMAITQTKFVPELMREFTKSSTSKPENVNIITKPRHVADSAFMAQMKLEYLDMDTVNLQNATAEQKIIVKKAIDRTDPFVKYENKVFVITVAEASELNMSERLFELMQKNINLSNSFIKDLNVAPDKNDSTIMRGIPNKME